MRHRIRGRRLNRNASHRKAMFRNMAVSLIRSLRSDPEDPTSPRVPGRIVTTVPKAKELRPMVEKLITMARKAAVIGEQAAEFSTTAERNSDEWRSWRTSDQWRKWNQAIAPAVTLRRRAFSILRDYEAVDVLFDELAARFADRPGGYTRIVRLAQVRLGDSGQQALIEFVGERDRTRRRRAAPIVTDDAADSESEDTAAGTDENAEVSAEAATDQTEASGQDDDSEAADGDEASDEDAKS